MAGAAGCWVKTQSINTSGQPYYRRKPFYLLQQVSLLYGLQHILLGGLLGFSTQQELIQDKIGFLEVEDNVQLAHLWNAINVNISLGLFLT